MTASRGNEPVDHPTTSEPLVRALDNVGTAVRALADESREERKARDAETREERRRQARRDRRNMVLLAVIGVLVVGLGVLVFQSRAINESNSEILRTVRDCTTEDAPGDCYERSQARTGALVSELIAAQFDIAWCVKISDTRQAAQDCVTQARRK